MNKRKHLEILDEYAAEALADVKKALRKQYDIVKKLRRELEEALRILHENGLLPE